jgi:hypothetical protein
VIVLATLAGLLIPREKAGQDRHHMEQAAMQHPSAVIVAGPHIVGDDPNGVRVALTGPCQR